MINEMILPFSTKFKDGTPTYFIDKIWHALTIIDFQNIKTTEIDYADLFFDKFGCYWDGCLTFNNNSPKRHTIREDKHDRWHAGRMIHPVINNRSKNQFQFAPVFPCISTQKIEIKYDEEETRPEIFVDGKELTIEQHEILAQNDGFPSVWEFYAWFDEDYSGKIIHWTNLKY